MPHFKSLFMTGFLTLFAAVTTISAQIQFKLQWMPDSLAWGVFARLEAGINPGDEMIIGSGQVTIVAPAGQEFNDLKCFSGLWSQNAFVGAPKENPGRDYISFGFISEDPPLPLFAGKETLLFTFGKKSADCPDKLCLIENDDPFNRFPNSANSNPGNDLSIMDAGVRATYYFTSNYSPDAWNCHPGHAVKTGNFIQGNKKRRSKDPNRP